MSFLLDQDCAEVEGIPSDEVNKRAMQRGSYAFLCALNTAKGLPLPKPTYGPAAKFSPLDRSVVEKYLRAPEPRVYEVKSIPGESLGAGVIRAVAQSFGLTPADIKGTARNRHYVCARMVASRLLRDLTWKTSGLPRFSLPQIGRLMGRDHSTIIHHLDVFDVYARKYPMMREVYEALGKGKA